MGEIRTRTELLADEIAQKIRQKIQKQEYAQGDRLTVRWLCEEFGASETPVKQALNQLVRDLWFPFRNAACVCALLLFRI